MAPKLETESVTRIVDGTRILDSISIRVQTAEVLAVIGPSGAGKSSFLRILNRLDEPTDGTVYLDGTDYRDLDPQEVRRRIGLVPQNSVLHSGTVFENVTLGARMCDEPIDTDRAIELITRMGLVGYEERAIADLSGGERQRVAIARTLYTDPEVLLLDEPTAHLDTNTEAQIEELLAELIRDHDLTCVIVTHDIAQAKRIGDRVVNIEHGRIVSVGAPEEVIPLD